MKWVVVIAVLLAAPGTGVAQSAAVPNGAALAGPGKTAHAPPRKERLQPLVIPQQFAPPQEAYASLPENVDAAKPAEPSACQLRLAKIASFKPLPTLIGAGECGATDAVLMDSVMLPDQSKVAVTPPATLRCPMAEAVATWLRDDVAPAVKSYGAPLSVLDDFASYECRGRNRVRAAQLSEHGRADALDVRAFTLGDGQSLGLTDINVAKDWRDAIRTSACARFSTVLGPGSDGYHEEHIHLDLAERRNNFKVCHWEVREPPPVEAKAATPPADSVAAPAAEERDAEEHDAAPIPLDQVPLPRPRPRTASIANDGAAPR